MRRALFVLLNSISIIVSATDYYMSSSGNDQANGISPSTPWQSIAKLNTVLSGLKPGDRVLFKRGDTFNGSLHITASGTEGNPIVFSNYGTGSEPVISGFSTISDWTNNGRGIFSKVLECSSEPMMVVFDGANTGMGRFPDNDWLTIDSHFGNTSLSDAELNSSTINWTGATVTIKVNRYTTNYLTIGSHSGNTINFPQGASFELCDGFGYFIQNDLRTLTLFKEWYYDSKTSTFYMYFGVESPLNHDVKVAAVDNGAVITGAGYITIDGLSFQGFNVNAIDLNNAPHITIQNSIVRYIGNNAIDGNKSGYRTSSDFIFRNNNVSDVNNCGLFLFSQFTHALIANNSISDVGLIFGTGYKKDLMSHSAIFIGNVGFDNLNTIIGYNRITNIGHRGISFLGTNITINNNLIDAFCLKEDDAGGIYTYQETYETRSCNVINNIILNGVGNISGTTTPSYDRMAVGIYTDGFTRGINIEGNSVAFCTYSPGYFSNSNVHGNLINNTFFANRYQIYTSGSIGLEYMTIQKNKFICKSPFPSMTRFFYSNTGFPDNTSLDYNCYSRPVANNDFMLWWIAPKSAQYLSLDQWRNTTGKDLHSYSSNIAVTNPDDIRFEYNASLLNKEIILDTDYYDVDGNKYSGKIILPPYTSAVLLKDNGTASQQSNPLLYLSSCVEDNTPSLIKINCSANLANIVSSSNTFTVLVNSSKREINNITVSGSQVLLTLASPIYIGDKISISYSAPSESPLQNTSGTLLTSFSNMNVSNNVTSSNSQSGSGSGQTNQPVEPKTNNPPVVLVSTQSEYPSGFVGEIDASKSYDSDKDILSYTWIAPASFPVSSTTGPKIRFLNPVVNSTITTEFKLNISDGKTVQSKTIPISIRPYRTDLDVAEVIDITASEYNASDLPYNILDGRIETMWSAYGDNQWIIMELKEPFDIQHVKIAFQPQGRKESYFDILASTDKKEWEPIFTKTASCSFSGNLQVFEFPPSKSEKEFKFVKIVGHTNSVDKFNYISEFRIFGHRHSYNSTYEQQPVKIYPNPAEFFVNISIDDNALNFDFINIINMAGKIVFRNRLDPGIRNFKIPIDFKKGLYILQMGLGGITLFTQKLIINNSI